jgi:hypothetical protein
MPIRGVGPFGFLNPSPQEADMSAHGKTLGSAFPDLPFSYPHGACVRTGGFRRSWVVSELTEANWDRSGLIYYSAQGTVVYATVCRMEQHGETRWQISRHLYLSGRLTAGPVDRYPTRTDAIQALNLEEASSFTVCGPVPEDEWPPDADSPWIIYSVPRGRAT